MRRKFGWDKKYLYTGVTALGVIVASMVVFFAVMHWRTGMAYAKLLLKVLMPVIYGLVLTYLLTTPMLFLERTLFKRIRGKTEHKTARMRRVFSLATTMILTLVILAGSLSLILPQVYTSVGSLVNRMPDYFSTAMSWILKTLDDNPQLAGIVQSLVGSIEDSLTGWMRSTLLTQMDVIITNLTSGVIGVVREIVNMLIGFVVAVYVLYHLESFAAQMKKMIFAIFRTKLAESLMRGIRFLDFTVGSFVSSKLLDSLIVGVVCWVVMTVTKMPYAVLISVLIGVTNIIPFFGPFIGGVPSALLILLENPSKCVVFVIFIVILQQIDGNILYPRIQGTSLGLSGFWILFAILLFGGLFGFLGFLFGVPLFAVIYNALRGLTSSRLASRGLPTDTAAYQGAELPVIPVAVEEDEDDEESFGEDWA